MGHKLEIENVLVFERDLHSKNNNALIYSIDARFKIAILLIVIALNIGLAIPLLSEILLGLGLLIVLISRPHFRSLVLFFIAPLLSTTIVAFGFGAGFGTTELFSIGPIPFYHEGFLRGVDVAVRVYCDVSWLALVFLTTSFSSVLHALRWFKIPGVLIETMAFMYRYSFLLFSEFKRLRIAAMSKGGLINNRAAFFSYASICGQIFLRAFDRSERIYWAMYARGSEVHGS